MAKVKYNKSVIKISGEEFGTGIDTDSVNFIAQEIKDAVTCGARLGLVVGGGNVVRGSELAKLGTTRAQADDAGMVATVINALVLQNALERIGVKAATQSVLEIRGLVEPYNRRSCSKYLDEGRVVILAGGTGNPYLTTDSAAAIKALELGADVLLKATKVEGVYSTDPLVDPGAKLFHRLTYNQVLDGKFKRLFDPTAVTLCRDNRLPIIIFKLKTRHNIRKVIEGEPIGTFIAEDGDKR
ncbi:MAG TPA: UMP kinase [Candidatus Avalokitesvara rifleensis]|uniref:UMP kinase n=1 Tax=Candidatus Avalokitesvara rifleensis TaxID=3367620 RepID=UPI002713BDCD|nr:UMP kinase [Candidatus Brocadiales bacterium]